jgi:hypothetical protein
MWTLNRCPALLHALAIVVQPISTFNSRIWCGQFRSADPLSLDDALPVAAWAEGVTELGLADLRWAAYPPALAARRESW